MLSLLSNNYLRALTVLMVAQTALFFSASGTEHTPLPAPLAAFPDQLADWHLFRTDEVDQETKDVLKADDLMLRVYQNDLLHAQGSLFIAYFQTQRAGQSPHSPKNCLPGSGWQPEENDVASIPVGGETISVNHYVVSKGDDSQIVYYWYQSQGRAIAGEFSAKFYLIADSIRKHRSDTALVRIIVPRVAAAPDLSKRAGLSLVEAAYPVIKAYLPQ